MPRSEEDPDAHELLRRAEGDAELVVPQHDPLPKCLTGELAERRARAEQEVRCPRPVAESTEAPPDAVVLDRHDVAEDLDEELAQLGADRDGESVDSGEDLDPTSLVYGVIHGGRGDVLKNHPNEQVGVVVVGPHGRAREQGRRVARPVADDPGVERFRACHGVRCG